MTDRDLCNDDGSLAIRELIQSGQVEDAFVRCVPLAEAGSTAAQLYLGWMYQTGKGVRKNLGEAERWYRQALSEESPRAAFYLATIYRERDNVERMLEWFETAASFGYAPAIYQLGRIHLLGQGVPVDTEKAWRYIDLAAREGHVFARRTVARELIRGRRGLRHIPGGFLMLFRALWDYLRIESEGVHTDLIVRG